MVKHPKPHFVKHQGKWQACYGNLCKGSKHRMQMVIAEDVNAFVAHCKYLEVLELYQCGKEELIGLSPPGGG